jgi:hypothetical protein
VSRTGGSVGGGTPVGSYRDKSMTMTPLTSRVSADLTSEGSSTSDEDRRRSGSVEGHHHSPDHLRGSMVTKLRCTYTLHFSSEGETIVVSRTSAHPRVNAHVPHFMGSM